MWLSDNVDEYTGFQWAKLSTQGAMQSHRSFIQSTTYFYPIVTECKSVDSDVGLTPRPWHYTIPKYFLC
jgi:hypothetical protein